jgi:hypothetical protein
MISSNVRGPANVKLKLRVVACFWATKRSGFTARRSKQEAIMVSVVGGEVMKMNSDNRQTEHDRQWSMVDDDAVVSVGCQDLIPTSSTRDRDSVQDRINFIGTRTQNIVL